MADRFRSLIPARYVRYGDLMGIVTVEQSYQITRSDFLIRVLFHRFHKALAMVG